MITYRPFYLASLVGVFVSFGIGMTGVTTVSADTAAVTAFSASAGGIGYAPISSGQIETLTWTLTNAAGHSLLIACNDGVKIKPLSGGTYVACGIDTPISVNGSDSVSFTVTNTTGLRQTVVARLTPKDITGQTLVKDAASTITFSVSTAPQPISLYTLTPIDGGVTVTWTANDVTGVNIMMNCHTELTATTTSSSIARYCGLPLFSTDLPASGSTNIYFTNSGTAEVPVTITLLPAYALNNYDRTHALQQTFMVPGKYVSTPSITSFTASSTSATLGTPVSLRWTARDIAGVNMKISCADGVGQTLIRGNSAAAAATCGVAFIGTSTLDTNGSAQLLFTDAGLYGQQSVTVTLYPLTNDGIYDGTKTKSLTFLVRRPQVTIMEQTLTGPAATTTNTTITNTTPTANNTDIRPTKPAAARITFTKLLQRNSTGIEVTNLQTFLARDKKLYPEGSITGTFGPATERAVQRFQVKYGIAKAGVAGYGTVGVRTRLKLNELQ